MPRAIFKVTYISKSDDKDRAAAVCGILANALVFCQLSAREFLVQARPFDYGKKEMLADLNGKAIGGRYRVVPLTDGEIEALGRIDWH